MSKLLLALVVLSLAGCGGPSAPPGTSLNVSGQYTGQLQVTDRPASGPYGLILTQTSDDLEARLQLSRSDNPLLGVGSVTSGALKFQDGTDVVNFKGVFTASAYGGAFTISGGSAATGIFKFTKIR